ncbi:MAG: aminoacyl-tRNA hydrolase [Acutalibacteraceae bacterium]|nr:aminoacyl-tRNA hydrolase [Acutalibacteraceae bacterium]
MLFRKKSDSLYDMLLVGLGNPGVNYENTRHNAGFCVIDAFNEKHGVTLSKNKFCAIFGEANIEGKRILVVKPQTYMNNSGEAVSAIARFYKIPMEKILVVSDDISLPPGKMRIRTKGSAGGQNGLKNIIEHLSSEEFARIKMGVGDRPDKSSDLVNWVLGKMSQEDKKLFDSAVENAVKAIETILRDGIDKAMNRYSK